MAQILGLGAVVMFGAFVLSAALPLLVSPGRWPAHGARWIVWGRLPPDPRPSNVEIRFWAGVWAAIVLMFFGVALAATLIA
jgi:hypothetical protein